MRVLLGSGGIGTEERTTRFKGLLTEHFEGCGRILFIPMATANHQDRVIKMRDLLGMNESISCSSIKAVRRIRYRTLTESTWEAEFIPTDSRTSQTGYRQGD